STVSGSGFRSRSRSSRRPGRNASRRSLVLGICPPRPPDETTWVILVPEIVLSARAPLPAARRSAEMKALWKSAGLLALLCVGATVWVSAGAARATGTGVAFGVAEDASKYAPDGGKSVYSSLGSIGMSENRWTLTFNGDP